MCFPFSWLYSREWNCWALMVTLTFQVTIKDLILDIWGRRRWGKVKKQMNRPATAQNK